MIYNKNGLQVYKNVIKEKQVKIDISNFRKGIYHIKFIKNENIYLSKIIKI